MKSKQQELNKPYYKTSCSDCVFAVYEEETQTGCLHGRVDKFGSAAVESSDDKRNFFVISRVCSLFRDSKWGDGKSGIEKSREEIELSFSILVVCDEYNDELSEKTLKSLEAMDYDRSKVNIILSQVNGDKKDLLTMYSRLKSSGFNPTVMASIHELAREVDGFMKTRSSSFVTKIVLGDVVTDCLQGLDGVVNDDLETPVIVDSGDNTWVLFMLLNMNYLEYNDYELFLKAAVDIAKKESKYIKINENK